MNMAMVKGSTSAIVTYGTMRNDRPRLYASVRFHDMTVLTNEESQMGQGPTEAVEIKPILTHQIHVNGSRCEDLGDDNQQRGGRETENARRMTRQIVFEHNGGQGPHSGTETVAHAIPRLEALLFQLGQNNAIIGRAKEAGTILAAIVEIANECD